MSLINIPKPILGTIKQNRTVYDFARTFRFGVGSVLGSREVEGINGPVHYNDFMLRSLNDADIKAYVEGAKTFVNYLEAQLEKARKTWEDVDSAFDVGCGYGRITRIVTQKMEGKKICVCDVIDDAASFVANKFQARKVGVHGAKEFPKTEQFDLVWLYSVFTHLTNEKIGQMINALQATIKPGGILVFTTHGWPSANVGMLNYDDPWPLRQNEVLEAMKNGEGYYYERYPHYKEEIGMTWHTPENIEQLVKENAPRLRLQNFQSPGVVGGHHDFNTYIKD